MRDLEVGEGITIPAHLLRAVTSRSGGPGGQNVNKVETKVTIEVDVDFLPLPDDLRRRIHDRLGSRINSAGVLRVTSQRERSQIANRNHALDRLEDLLRDALVEQAPRKRTRTPKVQKQKRLEEKKKRGETKRLRGRGGSEE